MMKQETDKAVIISIAIIEKDKKLLMVQESRKDVYGKWNLPGGHMDSGENPIQAVIRETKEETGFDVEVKSLASIQSFQNKDQTILRFNFNCVISGGSFKDQEGEILDCKWFSEDELRKMKKEGSLRSERTWWSISNWLEKRSFATNLIEIKHEI